MFQRERSGTNKLVISYIVYPFFKTLNSSVFMTKFNMMYVLLHFEVLIEREMTFDISNLVFGSPRIPARKLILKYTF